VTAVLNDTSAAQGRERVVADRVLMPRNGPGLPPGVADAARRLPGAETVSAVRATAFVSYVLGTPDVVPAQLVDPDTIGEVLDLRVLEGSLAAVKEVGTVAVSRTHAGEHDWHVGSRFHGWLADGSPVDLRVGAVFDRGLGFADVVLPRAGARAGLDSAVLVRARPGQADELDRALAALEREQPAVRALDREEYGGAAETSIERNITGTYLVLAVLVSFTAVSLVNTLVMGTAARTREFALLRAVGASRGQIVRMIGWETGIVLAIGVVVGTVIACVALAGANGALSGSMMLTGLPMPLYPLVLAGVAAMGLASGLLAAGMALLSRPMDALGGARE
jgi:putative ABC transport system permease protein